MTSERVREIAANCANFRPFTSQEIGYRSRGTCEVCGVPWQYFEVGELHRCARFAPRPALLNDTQED
jgi:hypothetical protein